MLIQNACSEGLAYKLPLLYGAAIDKWRRILQRQTKMKTMASMAFIWPSIKKSEHFVFINYGSNRKVEKCEFILRSHQRKNPSFMDLASDASLRWARKTCGSSFPKITSTHSKCIQNGTDVCANERKRKTLSANHFIKWHFAKCLCKHKRHIIPVTLKRLYPDQLFICFVYGIISRIAKVNSILLAQAHVCLHAGRAEREHGEVVTKSAIWTSGETQLPGFNYPKSPWRKGGGGRGELQKSYICRVTWLWDWWNFPRWTRLLSWLCLNGIRIATSSDFPRNPSRRLIFTPFTFGPPCYQSISLPPFIVLFPH